jgi:hypothetical protein
VNPDQIELWVLRVGWIIACFFFGYWLAGQIVP